MSESELRRPRALMYLSTDPDAPLVGLMYYSSKRTEPEGSAGRNDGWHLHEGICLVTRADGSVDAPLGAGRKPAGCRAAGGEIVERTGWMVHVWTVPGFDDVDEGPFAGINPRLACSDGTYEVVPPAERRNPLNACRSGEARVLDRQETPLAGGAEAQPVQDVREAAVGDVAVEGEARLLHHPP